MEYKKITSASTSEDKKRAVGLMDKIKTNQLEYKSPLHQAPISLRNQRRFVMAQNSYNGGQTMLCTLQSASFYLDPYQSYLTFGLEVTGTAGETFGLGQAGALNFIRSVVITSRSGVEVSRVDAVNLFHSKSLRFTKPKDFFQSEGSVIGFHDEAAGGYTDTLPAGGVSPIIKFCIPLQYVSPVFAPENSTYLPPFLCSGMRIEITLENANTALHRTSGSGSFSYRVVDPSIMCDLVKMSDKTDSVMTSVAHKAGLEVCWSEWDVFSTVTGSAKNTIDIAKTASKADKLIVCSRLAANVSNASVDSMQSEDFSYNEFQARVGSVYHPQTAITEYKEGYKNALHLFKSMRRNENDYPYASITTYNSHDGVRGGFAVLGTNFNRSSLLSSQSVPLNNSHSLAVTVGFDSAVSRQVDCFLVYKKIARVFTSNAIIYE